MLRVRLGRFAAAATLMGCLAGLAFTALPAAAGTNNHMSPAGLTIGFAPTGGPGYLSLLPMPPFTLSLDGSGCPFDTGALFSVDSGNLVLHNEGNNNGGWGGGTGEGTASLSWGDSPTYTGHLTLWIGNGNNSTSQAENGLTLDFHGSDGTGDTLSVHIDWHNTTNAGGAITGVQSDVNCGGSAATS